MALLYAKAPPEKRNKCLMAKNESNLSSTFPMIYRSLDANNPNPEVITVKS